MASDTINHLGPPFQGPDLQKYKEFCEKVPNGMIVRIPFLGRYCMELVGLEGCSLIIRLPSLTKRYPEIYIGTNWYVKGLPQGPVEYGGKWRNPTGVETTQSWLVDIAIFVNWFRDNPTHDAVSFIRCMALGGTGVGWLRYDKQLKLPDNEDLTKDHHFRFYCVWENKVDLKHDIPVACWCAGDEQSICQSHDITDPIDVATASYVGYVFYVRFGNEQ